MTKDTFSHLRHATLAQIAAEIVIDHVENVDTAPGDSYYNFRTEDAANAYNDIIRGLVDALGETAAYDLLDEAIAREWEAWNDKMFHN